MRRYEATLTTVPGIEVGHASDLVGLTGVTAVLCPEGAVGALHLRGGAVGGRQLASLRPGHLVDRVHGVILTGGSAFGLAAADGAMRALAERGVGFDVGGPRVPILPTAVIFDLKLGDATAWPDAEMGRAAVEAASGAVVAEGCVGVGTGASVGKLLGVGCATKGGLGTAGARFPDGLAVGALVVVNAFGDVRDPGSGRLLAGARESAEGGAFLDTWARVADGILPGPFARPAPGAAAPRAPGASGKGPGDPPPAAPENTTLAVVATNARIPRIELGRVARLAGDAFARMLSPGATRFDGDLVFALATGQVEAEPHRVGLLAREALEAAMLRAIRRAVGLGGLPASRDLLGE